MTDADVSGSLLYMELTGYLNEMLKEYDDWEDAAPLLGFLAARGDDWEREAGVPLDMFPIEHVPEVIREIAYMPFVTKDIKADVILLQAQGTLASVPDDTADPRERAVYEAQARNRTLFRREDAVEVVWVFAIDMRTRETHHAIRARYGEALPALDSAGVGGTFAEAMHDAADVITLRRLLK